MKPVAAKATFCDTLNFSAGREKSFRPAATKPHLASGAQKKIVLVLSVFGPGTFRDTHFGPAGWFRNDWNLDVV
jgi:hypothetical protein